jgi:hypothetical protein
LLPAGARVCPFCRQDCSAVTSDAATAGFSDARSAGQRRRDLVFLVVGALAVLGTGAALIMVVSPPPEADVDRASGKADADSDSPTSASEWLHRKLLGSAEVDASGNRTFGSVVAAQSGDSAKLPFPVTQTELQRTGFATAVGRQLTGGWLYGPRSAIGVRGAEPRVDEFAVPPGLRLVQVRYETKPILSLVSQVFNYVGQINQYFAVDGNGTRYPLAGYYAIVKRAAGDYLELFYSGDPNSPLSLAYEYMLDFKMVDRQELNDPQNAVIYLLFLVPPGTEITRIENQAGEGDDVSIKAGDE